MSDGEEIISSLFPGLKRRATNSHELKRGGGNSCSLEIGLEVGNEGSTSVREHALVWNAWEL